MTGPRTPSLTLDAETLLAHSAWLAAFARALVSNESEIDDVVQHTFARALERPPRHAQNLRGWLGAIARNVVRSKARSDAARVAREVALPPPQVESPVEAVERAELRRMVVESVLALDEPYRSAIALRFLEEMDVAAIARLTKSNEDTVRTRIRRGVMRVRELLEGKVDRRSRGTPDEGAAARALLFVRLREIAAGGGNGGASAGPAAGSSAIGRAVGNASRAVVRRLLVGAATLAVVAGGWWWSHRDAPTAAVPLASRGAPEDVAPRVERSAPGAVVERTADAAPANPAERTPSATAPTPEPPKSATVRGIVYDPEGNRVANANVWAIVMPSFELDMDTPEFGKQASKVAEREAKHLTTANWIATTSGDDGRYEIAKLSLLNGWAVGAFEPLLGARLSDVCSFDHAHVEAEVDLKLVPGRLVFGLVRDASLTPIGNANVTLYTTCDKRVTRSSIVTIPLGPSIGECELGFLCGEPVEFECSAPGFNPGKRHKIEFAPQRSSTSFSVALRRRPGTLVLGRIVDRHGNRADFDSLMAARLTTTTSDLLPAMVTVRAIPEIDASATPAARDAIDGRIDYDHVMYDLVLPEDFKGRVELLIAGTVVGSAPLVDPAHPPDLPCDSDLLPKEGAPTTFTVRFVDAETKEAINLQGMKSPPHAYFGGAIPAVARLTGSDPVHGVVCYGCCSGELTIEVAVAGHAPAVFRVDVPEGGATEPRTLELKPEHCDVDGVVLHADGRPFAKSRVTLYRADPEGWVDATGFDFATNPDGEFHLPMQAKGDHVLVAAGRPDEAPGVSRVVVDHHQPRIEVRCAPGLATTFRVAAAAGAGAAAGTRFRILDASGITLDDTQRAWPPRTCTQDDFVSVLSEGRYTVVVTRRGFHEARVEFAVPASEPIIIPLQPVEARAK